MGGRCLRKAFFLVIWPSRTVRKSQPFTSGRLPSASVPVNVHSETAVLVSLSDNTPFIGSVMTLPVHKGEGLARLVTTSSMSSLRKMATGTSFCISRRATSLQKLSSAALGPYRLPVNS